MSVADTNHIMISKIINVTCYEHPHWKCLHFVVVVGLEWPKDPKSYAGGSLLLVGSPLPDRSKVMAQTKIGTLVLQVGVWAAGWRPTPGKKTLVTKNQNMSLGSVKRRRTWRCLRIGTWNVLSLYRPGASTRDAERLGGRNWRIKARDRNGWTRLLESAKTLHGL
jgi:hypothetical protein